MKKMYTDNQNLWSTKSGDILWVGEMEDQHVINAYKFCVRMYAQTEQESSVAISMSFGGEMAQYYQSMAIDEAGARAGEYLRSQEMLLEEIKARGIEHMLEEKK